MCSGCSCCAFVVIVFTRRQPFSLSLSFSLSRLLCNWFFSNYQCISGVYWLCSLTMFSALAAVCTIDCAIESVLITLHYIQSVGLYLWQPVAISTYGHGAFVTPLKFKQYRPRNMLRLNIDAVVAWLGTVNESESIISDVRHSSALVHNRSGAAYAEDLREYCTFIVLMPTQSISVLFFMMTMTMLCYINVHSKAGS